MGEVATDCYSTRSYMTVVVDQLEDRGLVLVRCA